MWIVDAVFDSPALVFRCDVRFGLVTVGLPRYGECIKTANLWLSWDNEMLVE